MTSIYLDYNATTPIDPAVREAMLPYLGQWFGNPSSSRAQGRACAEAIDKARSQVAQMLGASASEVIFTAGGTESNNLAILGTMTGDALWGVTCTPLTVTLDGQRPTSSSGRSMVTGAA